jgi:SAM-dependent methyltransferase
VPESDVEIGERARSARQPGWKRLWRHSYALGVRWAIREARHGWNGSRRVGAARLLVPLDPWRYYEMGIVAEQPFSGRCLDVSSPKLLPSLLAAEGKGRWTAIDLFEDEIVAWRAVDPSLELEVQDATALRFEDDTFDHCICISVLEHVGVGADEVALGEMWRVLKPGGVLHLTTEVAAEPGDVFIADKRYGDASAEIAGKGFFFKHDYGVDEVERLVETRPWKVDERSFTVQKRPGIERWFYAHVPWSYATGPFLRFVCPSNFESSASPEVMARAGRGVVYLRLVKAPDPRNV